MWLPRSAPSCLTRRKILQTLGGAALATRFSSPLRVLGANPCGLGGYELTHEEEAFLDRLQRRGVAFFWEHCSPVPGQVLDRGRASGPDTRRIASIAATGFALAALCIAQIRSAGWERSGFVDAFNPRLPWYDADVLGIDQGISLAMAENLRSGFVWETYMRNRKPRRQWTNAGSFLSRGSFGEPSNTSANVRPGIPVFEIFRRRPFWGHAARSRHLASKERGADVRYVDAHWQQKP
jgi:hypothetical protein